MRPAQSDWFGIVDTAQNPDLFHMIETSKEKVCLFSGPIDPELARASPYLVRLNPEEALMQNWNTIGRGKNWGIMCQSPMTLESLRKHFRKFLQAMLPDGTIALFRFYDPRVFLTYIRSCEAQDYIPWFQGLEAISLEGANPDKIHHFHLRAERLYDGDTPCGLN